MTNPSQTSVNAGRRGEVAGLQNSSLFLLLLQMVPSLLPALQDPSLATASWSSSEPPQPNHHERREEEEEAEAQLGTKHSEPCKHEWY